MKSFRFLIADKQIIFIKYIQFLILQITNLRKMIMNYLYVLHYSND